jgi:hypothetical protein
MEAVYGAEGTGRLGLTLDRLLAGLDTLGVERETALDVVEAVAMDSVPPLRRAAFEYLRDHPGKAETSTVAQAINLPTNTVRRALEDLAATTSSSARRRARGRRTCGRRPPKRAGHTNAGAYPLYLSQSIKYKYNGHLEK